VLACNPNGAAMRFCTTLAKGSPVMRSTISPSST
jgi:hypothetical protein